MASKYEQRVCLICGSRTHLVLDIYEPRDGPNIVDIIYAKFKFTVDKNSVDHFICYDCNNWLNNWYSLQNANEPDKSINLIRPSGSNSSKESLIACAPEQLAKSLSLASILWYPPDFMEYLIQKTNELMLKNDNPSALITTKPLRKKKLTSNKVNRKLLCMISKRRKNINSFRRRILRKYRKLLYRNGGAFFGGQSVNNTNENSNPQIIEHNIVDEMGTQQQGNLNDDIYDMLRKQGTFVNKELCYDCQCKMNEEDTNDPNSGMINDFHTTVIAVNEFNVSRQNEELSPYQDKYFKTEIINGVPLKIPRGLSISLAAE